MDYEECALMSKALLGMILIMVVLGLWTWCRKIETSSVEHAFPLQLSESEWRDRLAPEAYKVLRQESTERAGSSPLDKEKRKGEFLCGGCGAVLFRSTDKFDSGTGWPSFCLPADSDCVGSKTDYKLMLPRTEVHCSRCGGHLGHLFQDGPKTRGGRRYCINGTALSFQPKQQL